MLKVLPNYDKGTQVLKVTYGNPLLCEYTEIHKWSLWIRKVKLCTMITHIIYVHALLKVEKNEIRNASLAIAPETWHMAHVLKEDIVNHDIKIN